MGTGFMVFGLPYPVRLLQNPSSGLQKIATLSDGVLSGWRLRRVLQGPPVSKEFGGGIGGDAVRVVGEDAFPMALDGVRQLLEWGQTAAHCPGAPRFEVESGTGCSRPGPSVLQVLAQRHRPAQFLVPRAKIMAQAELFLA